MLADSYGRVATDLRVSLTDRCNLRCSYCMPPEGLDWLPKPELLTDDELVRLIRVAVERLGITEVRFTGGEPLLRRGLPASSPPRRRCAPRPEISLTTNGIGLARLAGPLHDGRPGPDQRLAGHPGPGDLQAAGQAGPAGRRAGRPVRGGVAGLAPVKVNAVLMRGVNDDEAAALLRFCLDHGYQLRFIEQMPLDAQHGWRRRTWSPPTRSWTPSATEFRLTPEDPAVRGSAPAEVFLVDGGPATVGVIGSVTRPFCGACDRVRLTADGQIRNCLFARTRTTCAARCGRARPTPTWPPAGAGGRRPSCPGMASTTPGSCSRPGRCRPSAADRLPGPPDPKRKALG